MQKFSPTHQCQLSVDGNVLPSCGPNAPRKATRVPIIPAADWAISSSG
jgi:hypothetical protein